MIDEPVSEVLTLFFESFDTPLPHAVVSYAAIEGDTVRAVWRRCTSPIDTKLHLGFNLPLRGSRGDRSRLQQICTSIVQNRTDSSTTVSLGAAYSECPEFSIADLVSAADEAMYVSKQRGGDRATVAP